MILEVENSDGDDFESDLKALDQKIPGLAMAVFQVNVDVEYGEGDTKTKFYSPAGSSVFNFDWRGYGRGQVQRFHDEDEAVRETKDGWEFRVGGAVDTGDTAQNLHLALLPR